MTPVQCLARLAASSSWCSAVVALRLLLVNGVDLPATNTRNVRQKKKTKGEKTSSGASSTSVATASDQTLPPLPSGPRTSLGAGVVPPCYARIDWATLPRRIRLDDIFACPCGG